MKAAADAQRMGRQLQLPGHWNTFAVLALLPFSYSFSSPFRSSDHLIVSLFFPHSLPPFSSGNQFPQPSAADATLFPSLRRPLPPPPSPVTDCYDCLLAPLPFLLSLSSLLSVATIILLLVFGGSAIDRLPFTTSSSEIATSGGKKKKIS